MPITVKLSSSLRPFVNSYDPHQGLILEFKPGQTVAQLIQHLGLPKEKVKIIMINGISAPPERTLQDADRLGLFPAVGGG